MTTTPTIRQVATEDLCRSVEFRLSASPDAENDGFTIDGYAAVFDTPTRIDSWEGQFDEEIAFGAFARSLRAKMPKLQFDHGMHPLIGSIPIGRWTDAKEERGAGLHMIGRMSDNWLIEPVRQAIADEAIDGMSFRFSVVREEWRDKNGKVVKPEEVGRLLWDPDPDRAPLKRTLKEVKITEAGPVVWPAYQETSVGMRSGAEILDLSRLHEPQQRSTLARAVLLAEEIERQEQNPSSTSSTDGPQSTDAPPAEHSSPDDSQSTETRSPAEHPSEDLTEAHRRRDRIRSFVRSRRDYPDIG